MKGFATILITASVFVVAILLLSTSPTADISYNSNFSEMKTRISNYEILMLQMTQDCDWTQTAMEINNCLNGKKGNIEMVLGMPYTNCTTNSFVSDKDSNTAKMILNCETLIDSKKEGYFSSEITKEVVVKKYSQ